MHDSDAQAINELNSQHLVNTYLTMTNEVVRLKYKYQNNICSDFIENIPIFKCILF